MRIRKMNKGENSIVKDMTVLILCYGVLLQVVLLFFAQERLFLSTGLWIGIMLAVFMLVYMYRILRAGLGWGAHEAEKYVRLHSIIRYVVVLGVYGIVIFARLGSPLTCFAGIMGLKVAAYLQPPCKRLKDSKVK